ALAPQNLLNSACDRTTTASMSFSGNLDTTDCSGAGGKPSPQSGDAPEICVFRFSDITFPAGAKVRITGTRPAAFVATGTLEIDGEIDVAGHRGAGGAGALAIRQLGGNGANGGDNQLYGGGRAGATAAGGARRPSPAT